MMPAHVHNLCICDIVYIVCVCVRVCEVVCVCTKVCMCIVHKGIQPDTMHLPSHTAYKRVRHFCPSLLSSPFCRTPAHSSTITPIALQTRLQTRRHPCAHRAQQTARRRGVRAQRHVRRRDCVVGVAGGTPSLPISHTLTLSSLYTYICSMYALMYACMYVCMYVCMYI